MAQVLSLRANKPRFNLAEVRFLWHSLYFVPSSFLNPCCLFVGEIVTRVFLPLSNCIQQVVPSLSDKLCLYSIDLSFKKKQKNPSNLKIIEGFTFLGGDLH